jgi:hypothetical protein
VAVVAEHITEELLEPVARVAEETQAPQIPAQQGQAELQIQVVEVVLVLRVLGLLETAAQAVPA